MSEERGVRSRKWYETIELAEMQARTRLSAERFAEWQNLRAWQQAEMQTQAEMQPMSESHRAWQQQLQQAERQAQAAAEAEAQRADEPAQAWWCLYGRPAQMSDPPQSEQPATDTTAGAVQRRIDDVCQDLVAGRTTPAQRRGLGGAVERAGRIPTGSDAAVGRIARLPR